MMAPTATQTATETRLLRRREVEAKLGVSTTTLWRLVKAGRLPAPLRIGPQLSGWLESEIEAVIAERIAERDAKQAKTARKAERKAESA